jgi:hypothetical protein
MSDIVGTSTASFCRGEDYPRSVAVPVSGVPAVQALEGPFGQPEARLFLATLRAGHRGVSGRDQHHLPARPHATLNKFPLGRADRRPDFCWWTASFHSQRHRCHSAISARSARAPGRRR